MNSTDKNVSVSKMKLITSSKLPIFTRVDRLKLNLPKIEPLKFPKLKLKE